MALDIAAHRGAKLEMTPLRTLTVLDGDQFWLHDDVVLNFTAEKAE